MVEHGEKNNYIDHTSMVSMVVWKVVFLMDPIMLNHHFPYHLGKYVLLFSKHLR